MNYEYEKRKLYHYIGDELLDYFKSYKVILAGGAITSLFCNREINDLDIYFKSKKDCANLSIKIIHDKQWIKSFTNKALLFTKEGKDVQFIYFKEFKNPQDIFKTFDFTVNMGAFDFETEQFILDPKFILCNISKRIEINTNTDFPINTLLRIKKYEEKGYSISKPEILKLSLAINKLNINSWEELKNQLGGMYGLSLDDLFNTEKEFSLENAIECMSDIELKHGFDLELNQTENICDINSENLYLQITGEKQKLIKFKNFYFSVNNGKLEYYDNKYDEDYFYHDEDFEKYIYKGKKFYKYVKATANPNVFKSFYDPKFQYVIGEVAEANQEVGLYCGEYEDRKNFTYFRNKDAVLIELELEDISDYGIVRYNKWTNQDVFNSTLKKVRVVRAINDCN